jgi:hypothetical protein
MMIRHVPMPRGILQPTPIFLPNWRKAIFANVTRLRRKQRA